MQQGAAAVRGGIRVPVGQASRRGAWALQRAGALHSAAEGGQRATAATAQRAGATAFARGMREDRDDGGGGYGQPAVVLWRQILAFCVQGYAPSGEQLGTRLDV